MAKSSETVCFDCENEAFPHRCNYKTREQWLAHNEMSEQEIIKQQIKELEIELRELRSYGYRPTDVTGLMRIDDKEKQIKALKTQLEKKGITKKTKRKGAKLM